MVVAIWSNALRVLAASTAPASVISSPLTPRWNKVRPSCCSRILTCRLTALSLTFSAAAAFRMLIFDATTSKHFRAFTEGNRRVIEIPRNSKNLRSMLSRPRSRADPYRLAPQVLVHGLGPLVSRQGTRTLVTTERGLDVALGEAVDRDRPALERSREVHRPIDVAREHRRVQAVVGIVRSVGGLLRILDDHRAQYRTEDLLARNRHVTFQPGEHRRAKVASGAGALGKIQRHGGSFPPTQFEIRRDARPMFIAYQRPHLRSRIQRIPDPDLPGALHHAMQELVMELPVNKLAHVRRAVLARVPERGLHCALDEIVVDPGVVQNDEGALAPHLQPDALQVALGGISQEACADARRAGEGDRIDVRVAANRRTRRFTQAWQYVQYAIRNAGILRQLGKSKQAERRLLGWLDDDRAPRRKGRRKFPCRHEQGKVPGQHQSRSEERFPDDHGPHIRACRCGFPEGLVDQLGVPLETGRNF